MCVFVSLYVRVHVCVVYVYENECLCVCVHVHMYNVHALFSVFNKWGSLFVCMYY